MFLFRVRLVQKRRLDVSEQLRRVYSFRIMLTHVDRGNTDHVQKILLSITRSSIPVIAPPKTGLKVLSERKLLSHRLAQTAI